MVVKLVVTAEGLEIRLYNEQQKEQLLLKYNKQEILVEIDLAFKEVITIKALGLEVQTKETVKALEILVRKALENMGNIQEFSKMDLEKIQRKAEEEAARGVVARR